MILLTVVTIVLLAAYVSIGRQFMPAVSRYQEFFEGQLSLLAGIPVSIDELSGSFSGFNPVLQVNGLNLSVEGDEPSRGGDSVGAIYFNSATIILDVPRSIWQRQWVLEDFRVDNLEINVEQTAEGDWQLQGMSTEGSESVELAAVYEALLRISRLDFESVNVNIETQAGERYRFTEGAASIRNQDATHYIHATAFPEQSRAELKISLEVEGAIFNQMTGKLHVDIPVGDYSDLAAGDYGDQFELLELIGGAELWVDLEQGRPSHLIMQPQVSSFAFKGQHAEGTALQQINGVVSLAFSEADTLYPFQVDASEMRLSWNGINWQDFAGSFRADAERSLVVMVDSVNIDLLVGAALASGLLPPDTSAQLSQYGPKGYLDNLNIRTSVLGEALDTVSVSTNIRAAEARSVRGSPNLKGMDGYLELLFDSSAGLITGVGEIESTDFSMNIPNVFTSTWDYTYANGALDFSIDINNGQTIKLVSSVIVAESDAVDAHAKFATLLRRYPDGRRESELDLYVGTSRFDGKQKSLYLPDGPNVAGTLRNSMRWLDAAVLDGEVTNAGIAYRGSTVPGAPSELKTFQSYFEMEQGQLLFSEDWPQVNELSALIVTSDNDVDVDVRSGRSLDVTLDGARGQVRKNSASENWITINGTATGLTRDGLVYLQNAGVGANIKQAFSNWQAEGGFSADVLVNIPLGQPDAETAVRLDLAVEDNVLTLPDYSLSVSELTGPVLFDTEAGVENTTLTGSVFGRPAVFALSSLTREGELEVITVDAMGAAAPAELIEWPMQSDFVSDLLKRMDGEFTYTAKLNLDQSSSASSKNTLLINTDLQGAALNLPAPFAKTLQESRPLTLELGFGETQAVSGGFGDDLEFQLNLENSLITDGVVLLGTDSVGLENLADNDNPGLIVLGEMENLNVEQWSGFLADFSEGEASSQSFSETLAFVDIKVGDLELYDQLLPDVAKRVQDNQEIPATSVRLVSENILGQVDIPFSEEDYLLLDLEYLRLPVEEALSSDTDTIEIAELAEMAETEPVDALADIDPRQLPKMKFMTDDFSIGSRPYGSWQFTLDTTEQGAELTDLAFDFRGLRLGLDEEENAQADVDGEERRAGQGPEPHFSWLYDGEVHSSKLRGLLVADNMAEVLTANGLAAVFESTGAEFTADIEWPGSPAFFSASKLSGEIDLDIRDGRFLQNAGGSGALKLISIINLDAIMRRLRFSDDLLRRGLAYDEITAELTLDNGLVHIEDRLVISGPSSLYQITGDLDLERETIHGELYVTLPVSRNIPWIGLLTANIPLAVGAYLFDRIFGDQVNSLTSAVYTLDGPWEGLEPEFKQAFGSPDTDQQD